MGKTSRQRHMLWDTREPCHRSFMGQDRRRNKVEDLRSYQRGDGSMLQEVFFLNLCSSPGDNQSAGSWDREIGGSFQSDPLSLLGCQCCVKSSD